MNLWTWWKESSMNGESSIDIYILPCVKQIANEKLLYKAEAGQGSVITQSGGEQEAQGRGGDIYIYKYKKLWLNYIIL